MTKYLVGALAMLLALPALAQHKAHSHGVAELRVAVDGNRLHVELESPLDNLVGFEHAPRDARQRAALARAEERLRDAGKLFIVPATAGCELKEAKVESPWTQQAADDHGHGHAHADGKEEAHSDMHAQYAWECAKPAALKELGVNLFDAFPRVHRLRTETATPGGQGSAILDRSHRKLAL